MTPCASVSVRGNDAVDAVVGGRQRLFDRALRVRGKPAFCFGFIDEFDLARIGKRVEHLVRTDLECPAGGTELLAVHDRNPGAFGKVVDQVLGLEHTDKFIVEGHKPFRNHADHQAVIGDDGHAFALCLTDDRNRGRLADGVDDDGLHSLSKDRFSLGDLTVAVTFGVQSDDFDGRIQRLHGLDEERPVLRFPPVGTLRARHEKSDFGRFRSKRAGSRENRRDHSGGCEKVLVSSFHDDFPS